MEHVESNQCPKIRVEHFQAHRARKMLVRDYLADPEAFEFGARHNPTFAGVNALFEPSLLDDDVSTVFQAPSMAPEACSIQDSASVVQKADESSTTATAKAIEPAKRGAGRSTRLFGLALPDLAKLTSLPPQPEPQATDASPNNADGEAPEDPETFNPLSRKFAPLKYLHPITEKYTCPRLPCRWVKLTSS